MNSFKYLQPKSLQDASNLMQQHNNDALLFAGGTDALGLIKNNIIAPGNLVNLKLIKGLNEIKYTPGKEIKIGALVNLVDIAGHSVIREKFTVLAEAANSIASPQFRKIATIGGSLCQRPRCFYFRGDFHCIRKGGDLCYAVAGENKYHCIIGGDPCHIIHPSDSAVALLALDAKFSIYSDRKLKIVPAWDFFILPSVDPTKENILKPGEILESIIIPEPDNGCKSKYIKFMEREVFDFTLVSVAAVVKKSEGKIGKGRVAFGGVAPKPWQIDTLNKSLAGLSTGEESIAAFSKKFFNDATPLEKNAYKIPLVKNLLKRILIDLTA
ncbi:MAG: FAD binding domain-containing protein [Ignavibacteriaceae bacterium]